MTSVENLINVKRKLKQRYLKPPIIDKDDLEIDGLVFTPVANVTFNYPIGIDSSNDPHFLRCDSDGHLITRDISTSEIYIQDPDYTLKCVTITVNQKITLDSVASNIITVNNSINLPTESTILIDYLNVTESVVYLLKTENFVGNVSIYNISKYLVIKNSAGNEIAKIITPIRRPFKVDFASELIFTAELPIPYVPADFTNTDIIYISGVINFQIRYKTI